MCSKTNRNKHITALINVMFSLNYCQLSVKQLYLLVYNGHQCKCFNKPITGSVEAHCGFVTQEPVKMFIAASLPCSGTLCSQLLLTGGVSKEQPKRSQRKCTGEHKIYDANPASQSIFFFQSHHIIWQTHFLYEHIIYQPPAGGIQTYIKDSSVCYLKICHLYWLKKWKDGYSIRQEAYLANPFIFVWSDVNPLSGEKSCYGPPFCELFLCLHLCTHTTPGDKQALFIHLSINATAKPQTNTK